MLIGGIEKIDVADLQANTEYQGHFHLLCRKDTPITTRFKTNRGNEREKE
jgi:hypothetical protein